MQYRTLFAFALAAASIACADDSPTGPADLSRESGGGGRRQSGTTLSATKTATGFRERRTSYEWALEKRVYLIMDAHMVGEASTSTTSILRGETKWIDYELDVTRTPTSTETVAGVRGQVCVTNGGSRETTGLRIVDVVQTKSGAGAFVDYASAEVDVGAKPALGPGETFCYPYEVTFEPKEGAEYRNTARVTITNHSGHLGSEFGPGFGGDGVKAPFTLPSAATDVDVGGKAVVEDHGLISMCDQFWPLLQCTGERHRGWLFTKSEKIIFMVDIHNLYACGETFTVTNVAVLKVIDDQGNPTGQEVRDTASFTITTGECPAQLGCTRTQGYWKQLHHPWPQHPIWPTANLRSEPFFFFDSGLHWQQMLDAKPSGGDAYVILAHQYIAATMNRVAGAAMPDHVEQARAAAAAFFAMPAEERKEFDRQLLLQWKDVLASYNEGREGVPHCD